MYSLMTRDGANISGMCAALGTGGIFEDARKTLTVPHCVFLDL